MELKKAYPNYAQAINQMRGSTDLTSGRSNSKAFSHMMSYIVFGNKLGDISIDLNKYEDFVYLSIHTYAGFKERAKTTGERIYRDLSLEEWIEEIASVTNKHNVNPRHLQVVKDFTEKKINSGGTPSSKNSGCVVGLLLLTVPLFSYFLLT